MLEGACRGCILIIHMWKYYGCSYARISCFYTLNIFMDVILLIDSALHQWRSSALWHWKWKSGGVCQWHLGYHLWWILGQQRCQCGVQTTGILPIWYAYIQQLRLSTQLYWPSTAIYILSLTHCALLMWPPFLSGSSLHMAYYRTQWYLASPIQL